MSAVITNAPSSTVYKDIRSPAFRALLDEFKLFKSRGGFHWTFLGDTSNLCIDASVKFPLEQIMGPDNFLKLTPYKLDDSNFSLFPEWYYYFLAGLSERSEYLRLYIAKDNSEIRDFMSGTDRKKDIMLANIEFVFTQAFYSCTDRSVRRFVEPNTWNKEAVENQVVSALGKRANHSDIIRRKSELLVKAIGSDILPLVTFLMAFDYRESLIWEAVYELLAENIHTHKVIEILLKTAQHFHSQATPLLYFKFCDFISEINRLGIVPKKNSRKSRRNRRKRKVSDESFSEVSKRRKANDDEGLFNEKGKHEKDCKPNPKSELSEKYKRINFIWSSGSVVHITGDKSILRSPKPCFHRIKTVGAATESKVVGAVHCKLRDNSTLFLPEVYYVPGAYANYISVCQIRKFRSTLFGKEVIRLDTQAALGYVEDGVPMVEVRVIPPTVQVTQAPPTVNSRDFLSSSTKRNAKKFAENKV